MAKKTSANAKAAYGRYESENTAGKNKAIRAARHSKLHPNDKGGTPLRGAKQDMSSRPTKFEASLKRAVQHELLFGAENQVTGRDLSNSSARKEFISTSKPIPSTKKAA
ncbi:hypothetical protein VPHD148_0083 [Vibrio phage D148]